MSYMVGNQGELLNSLKGAELKDHVKSSQFLNSTAPIQKKEMLKSFANSITDSDDILMIVK